MTQPSTLCAARKMLDRLAAPLVARLPLDVAPNRDGPIDRLRPRIAIEPTNMMTSVRLVRTSHASEGGAAIVETMNLYLLDKEEVASRIDKVLGVVERLLA